MFDVFIDFEKSCMKEKLRATARPNIPAPTKRYQKYKVLGRDGELYENTNEYEDISFTISFNYVSNENEWFAYFRKYKKLFKEAKFIHFSDDVNWFYKIKKIDIGTNNRTNRVIGKFDVQFTVDPYCYLTSGKEATELTGTFTNFYDTSMPIYRIEGNGMCHLVVNGVDCTCNVTDHLIIDTVRHVSYKDDGTLQNTSINKDYDALLLVEGDNTIEITEGFTLEVTPNWRQV